MTDIREQVKNVLRDKTEDNNEYYDAIIPLLQAIAEQKTGRKFEDIAGGVLFVAKAAEYLKKDIAITSKSLGGLSISYTQDALPKAIIDLLPKRKWVFI